MNTGMIWQTSSTDSADTERLGELLGRYLKGGEVIELRSDLGGGKTTFVRGLARGLGSEDTVASPTFTLSKIYKGYRRTPDSSHLSGVQGDKGMPLDKPGKASLSKRQLTKPGEQRTETYIDGTLKEQSQPVTPQSAKSSGSVSGSARKQGGAVEEIWIHHFDFYRLTEPGIVADQLEESLNNPKVVTVVEWSDIVQNVLPTQHLTIEFRPVKTDSEGREVTLTYPDTYTKLVKQLEAEFAESRP